MKTVYVLWEHGEEGSDVVEIFLNKETADREELNLTLAEGTRCQPYEDWHRAAHAKEWEIAIRDNPARKKRPYPNSVYGPSLNKEQQQEFQDWWKVNRPPKDPGYWKTYTVVECPVNTD